MKYISLIIFCLLISIAGYTQQMTRVVNGQTVPVSSSDSVATKSLWHANDSTATANAGVDSLQSDLAQRPAKLAAAILYLKKFILTGTLTATQFNTFLSDARPQLQDYLNGSSDLITWLTTTYPNKSYYNATWQSDLINILQ